MIALGARLARAVNRVFRRREAVLAERFHHRVVRTPREARNALAYVLPNLRKHSPPMQGREHELGVEPASTGRWFDGWTRTLPPPGEHAPVAAARSWLLRIGWLRHGRIDPDGAPGGRR